MSENSESILYKPNTLYEKKAVYWYKINIKLLYIFLFIKNNNNTIIIELIIKDFKIFWYIIYIKLTSFNYPNIYMCIYNINNIIIINQFKKFQFQISILLVQML